MSCRSATATPRSSARAPRADGTALRSCGLLARTAQLSGVEVVSHGPDAQLEHTLRATLEPVASARSSLDWPRRTQLKARAARAARVAGIESDARAALANLNPPPRYAPAVARLRAALTDEAAGLTSLAKAARSDRRAAYTRATTQVSLASTGLHTATRALSPYQLGVSTLPSSTSRLRHPSFRTLRRRAPQRHHRQPRRPPHRRPRLRRRTQHQPTQHPRLLHSRRPRRNRRPRPPRRPSQRASSWASRELGAFVSRPGPRPDEDATATT